MADEVAQWPMYADYDGRLTCARCHEALQIGNWWRFTLAEVQEVLSDHVRTCIKTEDLETHG